MVPSKGEEQMRNRGLQPRRVDLSSSGVRSARMDPSGPGLRKCSPNPVLPLRVLLVDDDAAILRAYRRVLSPPHHIVVAQSGREALEILARQPFDCVVCDCAMPEMSGEELYEQARLQHPRLAHRFLFCSGDLSEASAQLPPDQLLHKPVNRGVLLAAIEQVCTAEG